jgi:N-sulfoglucosamine sulfohydrolase
MRRRDFLGAMTMAGALAVTAQESSGPKGAAMAPEARPRPNILLAISDDQSWCHTSMAGSRMVNTPVFDRVAREGVWFTNAYCSSPSCTPSRGALLTGQDFWRLEEGANLYGTLQTKFDVYPDVLEAAGYHVGYTRKGWAPGRFEPGGRTRNPAGPRFKGFGEFFAKRPKGSPFCFWFGSVDPHRAYDVGSGVRAGKRLEDADVPPFLPDAPDVRSDLLDYGLEIERFDREVGEMLTLLEQRGELDNTLVVITSDNGMPFPRGKCTTYDHGVRMPLAVRWPGSVPGRRTVDDFVSLTDLAPTFLEAAGLGAPPQMTGRSLVNVLSSEKSGRVDPARSRVFFGRERHTICRPGELSYPSRAIRTQDFLYIRNFEPDRWPMGEPEDYGDIDSHPVSPKPSPSKNYMLDHQGDRGVKNLFALDFGKRPAEELYDLKKDPFQMDNVARQGNQAMHGGKRSQYRDVQVRLRAELDGYLRGTGDPRVLGTGDAFGRYTYHGKKRVK